ncbi:thioesterase [Virgibacillus profundi]|uniref:Thioesterase n=1 Tax=Virgibacillus profundi TaxID=2024555 RepID=A0A2A2ID99_9BACI|nr:thioesterase family protein [Virgibacillus profundi]PAV29607.1 thioesterase [Virgibacillus profundi]PXY53779.1 acyl-CoA thioesterase [Virgibacillus profundi]
MAEAWHQHNMRVQYKDTDRMGVVHHGNYVTWFEVGRTEWMRHHGMAYHKMEDQGLLLPVMDVNVTYKKSAYFDDCVAIFTKIANYSPVRLEFEYEARKISEEEFVRSGEKETIESFGELLAKGSTMHMWVNSDWKPARINKVAPEVYGVLQKLG